MLAGIASKNFSVTIVPSKDMDRQIQPVHIFRHVEMGVSDLKEHGHQIKGALPGLGSMEKVPQRAVLLKKEPCTYLCDYGAFCRVLSYSAAVCTLCG